MNYKIMYRGSPRFLTFRLSCVFLWLANLCVRCRWKRGEEVLIKWVTFREYGRKPSELKKAILDQEWDQLCEIRSLFGALDLRSTAHSWYYVMQPDGNGSLISCEVPRTVTIRELMTCNTTYML